MNKDMTPVYLCVFDNIAFLAEKQIGSVNGWEPDYISGDISKGRDCDFLSEREEAAIQNITRCIILDELKPRNTDYWFYDMKNLKEIVGFNMLDTSKTDTMLGMFALCESLERLEVPIDTSNVKDMDLMFWGDKSLKELNLDSFNTDKVNSMYRMFDGCENLEQIKANFNMDNIKNRALMFRDCKKIDLNNPFISRPKTLKELLKAAKEQQTQMKNTKQIDTEQNR